MRKDRESRGSRPKKGVRIGSNILRQHKYELPQLDIMEEDLTFCQNDDQAFKNKTIWCPGVLFVSEIMRNLPHKTQIVSHSN